MDDERLKNPNYIFGEDYFEETLERIRNIRSSERRFYQKITDIYSSCSVDYDKDSEITKEFFKTVQNKLHFAICFQARLKIKSPLNKAFNIFTIRKKRVQILIIY